MAGADLEHVSSIPPPERNVVRAIVDEEFVFAFHLVMVGVEKMKGSAVSAKVQEKFMYAGLAIIGSLLVFVMWADISRLFGK